MLKLQHISSGYGKRQILHGICANIEKGTFTSIIGPNGCGKSTLLKTAMGILPLMDGQITLERRELCQLTPGEIAKEIAYLSQGKSVPEMTVEQLVLHGRFPHLQYPRRYTQLDREIAFSSMARMNLTHLADQPLSALSGGMRQTAYIAMAMAQDTGFILLDEPTTYLDIANRFALMDILRDLAASGKGIVAVLHDIPLAMEYSHRILVMENGAVAAAGTPEEIYASGIIDKIFSIHLEKTAAGYLCCKSG